jgi:hypothetical protein
VERNAEILFKYLKNVLYSPKSARLNVDDLDPDFQMLGKGLKFFAQSLTELNTLAAALAGGDLDVTPPPPTNELAGSL